ncbi:MAG: methyltransferase domain-containing protein [Novosphingobium sp.]|nr:methyltransferase domain-containing protein [Novosphingobium sp.]
MRIDEPETQRFRQQVVDAYRAIHVSAHYRRDDLRGYTNLGYFEDGEADQGRASERLALRMMARLGTTQGEVLDVGCGVGGLARHLAEQFGGGRVHSINISEHQLALARDHAPGVQFHLMPAERLAFPDERFDAVVSLEAMAHFHGRADFLREAFRVLKPGGRIAATDVVFRAEPRSKNPLFGRQELYETLEAYIALWREAGFRDIRCEDATGPCWGGHVANNRKRAMRERVTGRIDAEGFDAAMRDAAQLETMSLFYVFVDATKPG